MILQALSHGRVENSSGRLHTAAIGPPASGKKLLTEAARLLNPAFRQSGHKLSLAGLVGAAAKTNGRYTTQPGLLPRAHRGTLVVEDFHRLTGRNAADVLPLLLQVMEDGRVHDSTASMSALEANTAVHLDLNRARDVDLQVSQGGPGLENVTMELLSRLDVIIEIDGDPGRQFTVARERAAEIAEVGTAGADYSSTRSRMAKVVVALLREELPAVRIPEDQRLQVQAFLKQLETAHEPEVAELLGMCVNRMTNSILKIAAPSARGNRRDSVSDEDLEVAFRLMRRKADFLRALAADMQGAEKTRMSKKKRRQADVLSQLGGQITDIEEYCKTADELGHPISQATGYRDLGDLKMAGMIVRRHGEIHVVNSPDETWQEGAVTAERGAQTSRSFVPTEIGRE